MVSANNMISPVSRWRPDEPYDYNGSAEKGWGFHMRTPNKKGMSA